MKMHRIPKVTPNFNSVSFMTAVDSSPQNAAATATPVSGRKNNVCIHGMLPYLRYYITKMCARKQ